MQNASIAAFFDFDKTLLATESSRIGIRFPTAKLLEWAGREAELEASDNVFATVVLAHLATQATRNDRSGPGKIRL